jgi:hypothetical protein
MYSLFCGFYCGIYNPMYYNKLNFGVKDKLALQRRAAAHPIE